MYYATNPGNVNLNPFVWFWNNSSKILLLIGFTLFFLLLTVKNSLWFLPILIFLLLINFGHWLGKIRHFKRGDSNPGIVISVNPTLVAVATNLTKFNQYYPVVKIIPYNKFAFIGDKIATVSLYYDQPGNIQLHWADFNPIPINYATNNKKTIVLAINSYTDAQWTELNRRIYLLSKPYVPGLYKIDVETSDWNKNKSMENESDNSFKIPERYKYMENLDPDKPINFGYKTIWAAVKSDNHLAVADFLGFNRSNECNWVEGTIRAYNQGIFVMPSVEGWVLVNGRLPINDLENPEFKDSLIHNLSKFFGEAQMFGSHRVSSFGFWLLSRKGELIRYSLSADGEEKEIGEPTNTEKKWNPNNNSFEILSPYEESILEIAEAWSINPMKLESMKNIGTRGIWGNLID